MCKINNRKLSPEKRAELRSAANERRRALSAAAKSKNAVERAEMLAALGSVCNVDGRPLSENNLLLLAIQAAAAGLSGLSMVGGFRQWQGHGRMIARGQKGLLICFPMDRKAADEGSDGGSGEGSDDGSGDGGGCFGKRFGWAHVWDISQTVEIGNVEITDTDTDTDTDNTIKDNTIKEDEMKRKINGESAENLNLFNPDLFEHAAAAPAAPVPAAVQEADDPAAALLAAFSAA